VEGVLQILALPRLFRVEEVQDFLDEVLVDEALEGLVVEALADDQLDEQLVYRLQVRSDRVAERHLVLLPRLVGAELLQRLEGPEDLIFNQGYNFAEVWTDVFPVGVLICYSKLDLF